MPTDVEFHQCCGTAPSNVFGHDVAKELILPSGSVAVAMQHVAILVYLNNTLD